MESILGRLWGGRNQVVRQQLSTNLCTGLQGREQVRGLWLGPLSRSAAARPGRSSPRVETCCTFQAKETEQRDAAGVEVRSCAPLPPPSPEGQNLPAPQVCSSAPTLHPRTEAVPPRLETRLLAPEQPH